MSNIKPDNFKKEAKEIIHSFSFEKRSEDFFTKEYPQQWKKIPKQEQDSLIKEFAECWSDPIMMEEAKTLAKISEKFETKKADITILFLGVILGISGNLVANILDRYFSHIGNNYNIIIIFIFLIICWEIYNSFINKSIKEMEKKVDSVEMLRIVNIVENYK